LLWEWAYTSEEAENSYYVPFTSWKTKKGNEEIPGPNPKHKKRKRMASQYKFCLFQISFVGWQG
jgi:hypothetical protein